MDIDAIAKHMPALIEAANYIKRVRNDPFVAANDAERQDALADFAALREFRDQIPAIMALPAAVDSIRQDLEAYKTSTAAAPVIAQEPANNNAADLQAHLSAIDEAIAALQALPTEDASLKPQVDSISAALTTFGQRIEALEAAKSSTSLTPVADAPAFDADAFKAGFETEIADAFNAKEQEITALKQTVTEQGGKIDELTAKLEAFGGQFEAFSAALDASQSDLGTDGPVPDQPASPAAAATAPGATTASTAADASTASPAAQDPS